MTPKAQLIHVSSTLESSTRRDWRIRQTMDSRKGTITIVIG
jgi:hypothetical protein